MSLKMALQIFYNEENAFNTFIRTQRFPQCVLVSKMQCKQNFYKKNSTGPF